jgi:hypothetical protein
MKFRSSPSPKRKLILTLLLKESVDVRKETEELLSKLGGDGGRRFVFKSTVPKTKDGKTLAEIRDNLSHIRCCVNSLTHQHTTAK